MEKIRNFIPKTYIPILFGSIILGIFGVIAFINLFLPNGPNILFQLKEIKSLKNPNIYLIPDTLIIDKKEKSGDQIYSVLLYGRLKSNSNIKRTLYEGSLSAETSRSKYSRLHFMFECTGCNDESLYVCECLPILRSNIHPNIYANNPYTLDEEMTKVILDLIIETYLFWIIPFLYIYWKLTQLLYHYLNRKIDEKRIKLFVLFMFCSSTFYAQELGKEILIEVQLSQKIEYHIYAKEEQNLFKVDDEYRRRSRLASDFIKSVPLIFFFSLDSCPVVGI